MTQHRPDDGSGQPPAASRSTDSTTKPVFMTAISSGRGSGRAGAELNTRYADYRPVDSAG
jgi:hypothetical protein